MSYDFSFTPKTWIALLCCSAGLLVVTFFSGLLVGRLHAPQVINPSQQKSFAGGKVASSSKSAGNTPAQAKLAAPESVAAKAATKSDAPERDIQRYCLQFGSYQDKTIADQRVKDLAAKQIAANEEVRQDHYQQSWFVVRMGSYDTLDEASQAAEGFRSRLNQPVLVRPVDSL